MKLNLGRHVLSNEAIANLKVINIQLAREDSHPIAFNLRVCVYVWIDRDSQRIRSGYVAGRVDCIG